jgi:uncharacterized membrane protein HdeD (DUF308 family)
MIPAIVGNWWAVVVRGLIAIGLGVVTLMWPAVTVGALVLLFGFYALLDGVFSFIAAFKASRHHERWGYLLGEGIVGVLAGVLTFAWPAITTIALVYMVAAWAVVTGVLEIAAAFRLRKHIAGEILLAIAGVVSIAFGIMLVAAPLAGVLVIAVWIGIYELIFGGTMLALGLRLRRWSQRPLATSAVSGLS